METGAVTNYDALAEQYDRFRTPAPTALYEILRQSGMGAGSRVLDLGIGTGLASEPLAQAGAVITGIDPSIAMLTRARTRLPNARLGPGRAEALPFEPASFDAAIAAEVFHLVDQPAALAQLLRVVRKGGTVAIWWPSIATESNVLGHRAAATRDLGLEPIVEPTSRGFRSFYAAPFAATAVRVVPGLIRTTVEGWMSNERTRAEVRTAYGEHAERWLAALEGHLLRAHGAPEAGFTVRLIYYLYLGTV
ncbi:MAG TPA: class I SAM-dependent methyltransferase [Candidatus Limnocylindria bacterium]|jgi:ubiquinone/menaquinone biosynthesis C-methylase UbiE|nr:class I SAM-dependent methyltransferase [Candidatus Limnocylindria bacterium]